MLRKTYTIVMLILVALTAYAAPVSSPWDHQGTELSQSVTIIPGTSPITYSSAFTREREMYGYNPRFMPQIVFFDRNNRPFILSEVPEGNVVGSNTAFYTGVELTDKAYIQTLNDSGNWVVYNVMDIMRELYGAGSPYYSPLITTGYQATHRIVFDNDNNLYFTLVPRDPWISGSALVYSTDAKQTWQTVRLDRVYNIATEAFDTFASSETGIPTISNYTAVDSVTKYVSFCRIIKDAVGNMIFDRAIPVAGEQGRFAPGHSGYLNFTVTVGKRVHFFWLDWLNQEPNEETAQYHNYYDKTTGYISEPTLLGSTVGTWYGDAEPYVTVDPHNGPTATVDKNKNLHVILGGHGSQAKYTYSTDKGKTWAAPINLPGENYKNTYPTMITDRKNTLHLVYRATIGSGDYRLSYSRKKEGQSWEDMGALVVPGNDGYSVYHHTMTVDRLGRIFLQYYYKADTMSEADKAEYRAKWPALPDPDVVIYAHDPVIIMSDNGGDTWKIATTADFAAGLIDDTIPVAVYNFDSAGDLGLDMAGYDNNFDVIGQPAAVTGIVGGAVSFGGVSDALIADFIQADAFDSGAFTVAGWVKLASQPGALANLVSAKTGSRGFALAVNNGQWSAYTYADGFADVATAAQPTVAGQWTHIAFTYKPSGDAVNGVYTGTTKVYVNGQLAATGSDKKYNPAGAESITIGGVSLGYAADEFGVFKGAMPIQKIAELAANTFIPANVSIELLYRGDFNGDGIVDEEDLKIFAGSWLQGE